MIREGGHDVTLRFLADSPKRMAISQFTEGQTQGTNIRRYFEYLLERVKAYDSTKTDFVQAGTGKMRSLTVDKGLLRQTEVVQTQIRALLKCDLLGGADPDNEIAMTAFRLLTMDLLELFKVMNEGTINVLEHYFEMSKVDAKRALNVYKTFGKQTDLVVNYLSTARQYQALTRLEVPKLKHAPTTLTSSLEDYLNDPDFDINRRQYLAQQEAKRTGRPVANISAPPNNVSKPTTSSASVQPSQPSLSQARQQQAKGPAPDLIDFFESIDQNQQPMAQQAYQQQQQQQQPMNTGYSQPQIYQQPQIMPQQSGYNPFMQNFGQQPQPQPQPAPILQPDFTGAGFGGYGPQPTQQSYIFNTQLSAIPQGNMAEFPPHSPPPQISQSLQPQPTGTNPFRQSMLPNATGAPKNTNPFARDQPQQSTSPPFQQQQQQQPFSPQPLQVQKTGTNPFAKTLSPPPATPLTVNVTGSTNPFRQSQFVNQQTGQGWQHSTQGTFGGYDINGVPTTSVFPRPGAQQT